MSDRSDRTLGERELDVMGVLWDLGSGTVTEVRDKLPADLAAVDRLLSAPGVLAPMASGYVVGRPSIIAPTL